LRGGGCSPPKWVNPKSVLSQISTPIFPSTLSENTHPGLSYTLSRTALTSPALSSDDVMFYSLECKPCTVRCHCCYLPFHPLQFCLLLLAFCAYSDEPELTTTAPITTTTTGEATTTAGTDMRSVLQLASFVLRTKIYYRRRTARRDVTDKTLITAA